MKVTRLVPDGLILFEPDVYRDDRGFFSETYRFEHYREAGVADPFVQDNLSFSRGPVLRGLHLQNPRGQGKLVSVMHGEVFDVAVDVRRGSPTFGHWAGVRLSLENHRQLYVPVGFAHGFCVLSDEALFAYKCTDIYNPETQVVVSWDDPDIGIEWPVPAPMLSAKDAAAPRLCDIPPDRLPSFPAAS